MADKLRLDWESASDVDLTKVGLDVYSAHPSTRVLMGAYRINNGPYKHWEAHRSRIPAELVEALEDPDVEKHAFGAQFERVMANRVLGIRSPIKGWRCSMALAYMMSFHGGLEDIGEQIGLPQDLMKMKEGKKLIHLFSMPQRITKNQPLLWRDWDTDPELWLTFCQYNIQDVVTEEAIDTRLGKYEIPEWRWSDYELDQEINDRGIPADIDFIENIIWMSARRKSELTRKLAFLTELNNPNSVEQLKPWLQERGYPYDDLRKHSVAKAISLKLGTKECRRALRLRQWASKTSVQKANTAKLVLGEGNRLRYLFQFCGASRTNRWSGRSVQSQNMTVTPKVLDAEEDDTKLSFVTDLIRTGDYEGLEFFMGEPMIALSGCMRSLFRTEDHEEFVVADLKSIESAVIAWVTQCDRLLGVFRDGKDPYKDFGTEFYRKAYDEITRIERGVCKPPALGCGFRLSGGTILPDGTKTGLLAYAENMGVVMTIDESAQAVKVYRSMYSEIPAFWKACEAAAAYVIRTKKPKKLGFVEFHWAKPFLLIRLPSGRDMFYYKPMLQKRRVYTGRMRKVKIKDSPDNQHLLDFGYKPDDEIEIEESYIRETLTYMGKDQKTNKWVRLDAHGGVTTENIVQTIAYDVLMVKLRRMKQAGFDINFHAHDEGGAIVRKGENRLTLDRLLGVFKEPIDWAPGLPLGAAGWTGEFYRKA